MTVIGLDTSVVVRLLVGLPEDQARLARERLERAEVASETVLVTDLVIAEAYHALHYHYEVPKDVARGLLLRFVTSGVVSPDPPDSTSALASTGGAGLVDRLIHSRHRNAGGITLTFEQKQARLEGAERLVAAPASS